MKQIPCRDFIQAHCLRSWLLSHGIEARVIHEDSSGLFTPTILPIHVAIDDADVARYDALEADSPLDESFEPVETEVAPDEDSPPASWELPSFSSVVLFGLMGGAGLGLLGLAIFGLGAPRDASALFLGEHVSVIAQALAWFLVPGLIVGAIAALLAYALMALWKARRR